MNAKKIVQMILAVLFGLDLGIYLGAKADFLTRYNPHAKGVYFQGHWIYWVLMAFLGLVAVLVQRLFPETPNSSGKGDSLPRSR